MTSARVFITKGPYCSDRFADRRAAQDDDLQRGVLRLLVRCAGDGDRVALAEHGELAGVHRTALGADGAAHRRARRPAR